MTLSERNIVARRLKSASRRGGERECAQAIGIEKRWLLLDHKPLQGGLTASQAQQHSNQMTRRRQAKMPKASCRSTDPLVIPPMYAEQAKHIGATRAYQFA
jgi:hypothetical protein